MRTRCSRWFASAVLVMALAAGCARPPDEAWLRFVGFQRTVTGGTSPETVQITVLEGLLRDNTSNLADARLQNASVTVGKSDGGAGILVERVHVEYPLAGYALPVYEYPIALYIPPLSGSGTSLTGGSAVLGGLPLVPASLKQWLLVSGIPLGPQVHLTASVTFYAKTDDGTHLETPGGIAIVLSNK